MGIQKVVEEKTAEVAGKMVRIGHWIYQQTLSAPKRK